MWGFWIGLVSSVLLAALNSDLLLKNLIFDILRNAEYILVFGLLSGSKSTSTSFKRQCRIGSSGREVWAKCTDYVIILIDNLGSQV